MGAGSGVRLAVLASGSGTILEAVLAEGIDVALVVADRPCRALRVAEAAGVAGRLVERTDFGPGFDREAYTAEVVDALRSEDIDLVAMAGFMTVLGPAAFDVYGERILNTHPALLPAFRGAHAVRDALAAGVQVTGCTVHIATPDVDSGPILAQQAVPVLPGDTEDSLHERIKAVERRLYPATLAAFAATVAKLEPPTPRRRALVSVYDKTGVEDLARGLVDLGFEVLSSGGTAAALEAAGVPVTPVDAVTGWPAMLGGRVKTLHPLVHGGILADRDNPAHVEDLRTHRIAPIDVVAVNLYPFTRDPSVELIDIGGPAMVRAAAKNHAHVAVVVDPSDYAVVLGELRDGGAVSPATRRRLAATAFAHTAVYDTAIAAWLSAPSDTGDAAPTDTAGADLPARLDWHLERVQDLRYGENPHQNGARYRFTGASSWWDEAVQLGGKQLSYLNLYDTEAAWRLAHELAATPAARTAGGPPRGAGAVVAVIVKHANPCGVAVAPDVATAYRRAHECDPTSAFGGIVALSAPVDRATAEALAPVFTEVVVAPAFEPDALEVLTAKKNLRVLVAPPPGQDPWAVRSIDGGLLVQHVDRVDADVSAWEVVTRRGPTDDEWAQLALAWVTCARVSSNAIVLAAGGAAVGVGAGQQSRVDAARIAAEKAAGRAAGGAAASDAFFPFPDGLLVVADAGVTAVAQPGGSVRDAEVIAAADERGLAMVFTGRRHFRH